MNKAVLLFIFLILTRFVQAAMLNVPSQYPTIQDALNNCSVGDTIMVAPGTYYEHLVWPEVANIKLFSSGNKTNTIIDGSKNGRVITIDMMNEEVINKNTQIKGFTITRGTILLADISPVGEGAGILLNNASPKISNCNIIKNYITAPSNNIPGLIGYGGGVSCRNSQATFSKCLFKSNQSKWLTEMYGSAVYGFSSSISLTDCEVSGNMTKTAFDAIGKAAGVIHVEASTLSIERCSIVGNNIEDDSETYPSGAVTVVDGSAEIINTLFRDNTHWGASEKNPMGSAIFGHHADLYILNVTSNQNGSVFGVFGASLYLEDFSSNTITVQNSIFWNNGSYDEINSDNTGFVSVSYSDIKSSDIYPGTGNLNSNPEFISIPGDNLLLQPTSPCAGAGSPVNAPGKDLLGNSRPLPAGTNPDMGCYEINQPLKITSEVDTDDFFSMYPNPTNGTFALNFKTDPLTDSEATIQVINALGQIVYATAAMITAGEFHHQFTLPTTVTDGIYFVRINVAGQFFQDRLVYEK